MEQAELEEEAANVWEVASRDAQTRKSDKQQSVHGVVNAADKNKAPPAPEVTEPKSRFISDADAAKLLVMRAELDC